MSTPYSPAEHQLVAEVYVTSLKRSVDFYTSLGFKVDWTVEDIFAQISWDGCLLFLKVKKEVGPKGGVSGSGNVRIMLADVDAKYEECKKFNYKISQDIGDRLYVLRDFIIEDPDGYGVRFGSFLGELGRKQQRLGPTASG